MQFFSNKTETVLVILGFVLQIIGAACVIAALWSAIKTIWTVLS